ncbi:MAG: tail fiber protein [Verrucomicrobiota bacterium]
MADPFISEIIIMGCNYAPRTWSTCQGQLLPITQNTALFSLVGTMYGGDGRSTFGLPDGKGRVFTGYNPNFAPYERTIIGEIGGYENVQLNQLHLPVHKHTASFTKDPASYARINTYDDAAGDLSPNGNVLASARDSSDQRVKAYSSATPNATLGGVDLSIEASVSTQANGGSQSFQCLAPFQSMNYVIALDGVYPPRS